MDDEADLEERASGCPMERAGWRRHPRAVRGLEKLTGAGMTFLDADAVRLLEEVRPARLGGAPSQYHSSRTRPQAGLRGSGSSSPRPSVRSTPVP